MKQRENSLDKYIGTKLGIVTIKSRIDSSRFLIKCDCGIESIKHIANLIKTHSKGNVVSCGCERSKNLSNKLKGKPSPKKIFFTDDEISVMVNLYNQKINVKNIGDKFGVSPHIIKSQLQSQGCEVKQRTYDSSDYFKTVDSEEKAYWLGFLAADGCIRSRVRDSDGKTIGDYINLKLSLLDEKHMEKFRDSISPKSKIYYHTGKTICKKGNVCISHSCVLGIYGNELVQDVMKLGLHPKKTHTIDKPNIDEKYYRHFIRGFFDGDGCIHTSYSGGYPSTSYRIACASELLKDWMLGEFEKCKINFRKLDKLSIGISTVNGCNDFYHYLYDDSTIYLQRKKDKGDLFIEHYNKKRDEGYSRYQSDYIKK